ncbi:hypothetical protein [Streptomyces tritici]|uniref:hypothetical protein n=1 Tax=Streptomyces tritici TaxID=2054410 RepID=UPI003AF1A83F
MSATPGATPSGAPRTLFDLALRYHRTNPDAPLPRGGARFPLRPRGDEGPLPDHTRAAVEVAALLDRYFADPRVPPRALAARLDGLPAAYGPDEHIGRAAARAPAAKARQTGRWLVRHGTGPGAVCAGLALLAEAGTAHDIPRIQTIGLHANAFGHLAAVALERLPGGVEALLWLADRVTEWGRVHVVHELCRHADAHPAVRPWLLRKALARGEFLNSYVVDHVLRVTAPHEAVVQHGRDTDVMDHAGRLLHVMTYAEGMGTSLRHYPHALAVLEAHVRHLGKADPTVERYFTGASVAHHLGVETPVGTDGPALKAGWDTVRKAYLGLLDRAEWCATAREGLAAGDEWLGMLAHSVAPELGLRAYLGDAPGGESHGEESHREESPCAEFPCTESL